MPKVGKFDVFHIFFMLTFFFVFDFIFGDIFRVSWSLDIEIVIFFCDIDILLFSFYFFLIKDGEVLKN